MKGLLRPAHIGTTIIMLTGALPAIVLPNAAARADFDEDTRLCIGGGGGPESRIAACTRQIKSGRWQGHNFAVICNNRGIAYGDKGEPDRAIEDYNRTIALDPTFVLGYNNRGNAYNDKHDYDRAIADYSAALKIEPKFVPALNARGFAYFSKGDLEHAFADYNQALALDPKFSFAYTNRAIAYNAKGD